jgi:predicted ester cyclase
MREAFPDARFTIEDMVGEGDKLADRYTISGTHIRPVLGIAPTGRKIQLSGITIVRISGGRSPNAGPSPISSACCTSWAPSPGISR